MYSFFTIVARKQYRIGTNKIIEKYLKGIGTSPIYFPIKLNGIIIATMLNPIDVAYTAFELLLSINGVFAVLITCNPTRFDTTPYENHIDWNSAASGVLNPNPNHNIANTIKSNTELAGPIHSINLFMLFIFHLRGFDKYSLSTLS